MHCICRVSAAPFGRAGASAANDADERITVVGIAAHRICADGAEGQSARNEKSGKSAFDRLTHDIFPRCVDARASGHGVTVTVYLTPYQKIFGRPVGRAQRHSTLPKKGLSVTVTPRHFPVWSDLSRPSTGFCMQTQAAQ